MSVDYQSLRQAGIRHLERLIGSRWTDFNVHDPGITILEQLCFALTDLGYRTTHDLPDLLSEGGADPYENLFPPARILTTRPVTVMDLRTLLVDVEGIRNAWVEPLWHDPIEEQEIPLHYLPQKEELRHGPAPEEAEAIKLKGLYRVLIENADPARLTADTVRARAARRLHANRGLCEDFAQIRVLEPQWIRVCARVEIDPVDDIEGVLASIFEGLTHHVRPPIPFTAREQLLAGIQEGKSSHEVKATSAGRPSDEVFEGPLLNNGYLAPEDLAQAQRRTVLRTSDLIQKIMDVPGVRAVRTLSISAGGEEQAWSLRLDPTRAPVLDMAGSQILLERDQIKARVDLDEAVTAQRRQRQTMAVAEPGSEGKESTIEPPAGRDRRVGAYDSIQRQFPAVYGIGELGLPRSAHPRRRAQARQLKAYLLFFDQLLANSFAQLARVKDLFSFHGDDLSTAFTTSINDSALGLDDLYINDDPTSRTEKLQTITEGLAGRSRTLEHKNRLLNHLLARFAEQFADYGLVLLETMSVEENSDGSTSPVEKQSVAEKLARDKQAFLRRYPQVSSARGTGRNCLQSAPTARCTQPTVQGESNVSGLEERIRLKLGFMSHAGEELVLVEHILLRPIPKDHRQQVALLTKPLSKDPYSLQLSFILPQAPQRFQNDNFRRFIEQTIREETPAHLTPYVHWLSPAAWGEFCCVHEEWLRRRSEILNAEYALQLPQRTETIHLRAIRDRLLDLLHIGQTFPLQDALVRVVSTTDGPESCSQSVTHKILVWPGPADVRYELCNVAGLPVASVFRYLPGHPAGWPPIRVPDERFESATEALGTDGRGGKILARKLSTGRETYLHLEVAPELTPACGPTSQRLGLGVQQLEVGLSVGTAGEELTMPRSETTEHTGKATELVIATDPLGLRHSAGIGRLRLEVDFVAGAGPYDPWHRPGLELTQVQIDLTVGGEILEAGLGERWLEVDWVVGDDEPHGLPTRARRC